MKLFLALAVLFGLNVLLPAAPPEPAEKKAEPIALKVKKALDETGDVVFDGNSLEEVVTFFKNRLRINVTIDPSVTMMMADAGGATAPAFTVSSRNGKYRDALRKTLESRSLHFAVVANGVIIGSEDVVLSKQLRQMVSLDANGTSLATVLKNYADETGANIVLDPRQAKAAEDSKVTLKLDDVPLETAVRLATEVGGLRVVRMNNVLFVTNDARADKLRADSDGPVGNSASMLGGLFGGAPPNAPVPIPPPPPAK